MISHRFETIFVHVPKTAGQSVELAFLQAHGLTWDQRAGLLLQANPDPASGPERLAHLYASEYRSLGYVDESDFDRYFKFALVRNPYDRAISEYNYRFRWRQKSFERFLRDIPDAPYSDLNRHMQPQARFISDDDGTILVDEIVRFEEMTTRVPEILSERLGRKVILSHRNSSRGIFKITPRELPRRILDALYRLYEVDFDLLRYPRALTGAL